MQTRADIDSTRSRPESREENETGLKMLSCRSAAGPGAGRSSDPQARCVGAFSPVQPLLLQRNGCHKKSPAGGLAAAFLAAAAAGEVALASLLLQKGLCWQQVHSSHLLVIAEIIKIFSTSDTSFSAISKRIFVAKVSV